MATILIVDDEPLNRELLHAYLEGAGHTLLEAASGEAAVAVAREERPDLVLLDVMMPGKSGFDVVAQLKAEHADELLPVILVTALADHDSRLRGLRAGADEFLTKPVERNELLLRVSNLLALRAKEAALVRRNVELIELQRFRDEMSAMVVHDLKNPLSAILANVDYALEGGVSDEERHEALLDSRAAGSRAMRLLANLADLTRIEVGHLHLDRALTAIAAIVEPLVHQRTYMARSRNISIETALDPQARIYADAELVSRVVENVLDNALRHTPPGGRIAVRGVTGQAAAQLKIGNTGAPIPADARLRIFEKFAQTGRDVGRMNLGLGLYFCRLAAEAHGGRMWVEESPDLPTVFALELPAIAHA